MSVYQSHYSLLEVLADLNIKYNSDANESRIYYMPIKANCQAQVQVQVPGQVQVRSEVRSKRSKD